VDEMWERWLVPGIIPFRKEVEEDRPPAYEDVSAIWPLRSRAAGSETHCSNPRRAR
jgi:hypothetical protein